MLELLTLAYSLSVLTYHIGALIYLIPIPWRGVKKWAPTLIYDGWASAALASSFYIIQQVTYYLYETLGGSWEYFKTWILEQTGKILVLIGGVTVVKKLLGGVIGSIVGEVASPIMWALGSTIFTLELMLIIGEAVKSLYPQLLAIGILLYAVPFRLTRGVGSGLIAFATVFYICLPLLPAFIGLISSPNTTLPNSLRVEQVEAAFVRGRVFDSKENPVPNVYLRFKLESREVASYSTDSEGYFDAGRPRGGLPLKGLIEVNAYYLGVEVRVKPNPIDPSAHYTYSPLIAPNAEYYLELHLEKFELLEEGVATVYSKGVTIANVKLESRNLTLQVLGSGRLTIILPSNFKLLNSTLQPVKIEKVVFWGRVLSWKIDYYVRRKTNVTLTVLKLGTLNVDYPVEPMLENLGFNPNSMLEDLGREASKIFFSYFLLPMGYLGVLTSISTSLARLIGGTTPRVPFRW